MSEKPGPYVKLEWDDIAGDASELFNVWATGSELEWAKRAWAILGNSYSLEYADEIDRTSVLIRLLTLALLYREWCWLAREESCHEGVILELATEAAGINPFRVAQLIGKDFAPNDANSDEHELLEEALTELVNFERSTICHALVKGFGGEVALHNSLAATTTTRNCEDDEFNLENGDFRDGRALGWIFEGMPRL